MTDAATALAAEIGTVRRSGWRLIDQPMIDAFADVTGDRQFIHVDPVRAAETPFGGTVAHGFLTLSLMSALFEESGHPLPPGVRMGINYGTERLRFIHPVRAGKRIRLAAALAAVEAKAADRLQLTYDATIEIEGETRPALTAVWLFQLQL